MAKSLLDTYKVINQYSKRISMILLDKKRAALVIRIPF